jgi:hypothetical protein
MVGFPRLWVGDGRTKTITTGRLSNNRKEKKRKKTKEKKQQQQHQWPWLGCCVLVNLREVFVRTSGDYGAGRNRACFKKKK